MIIRSFASKQKRQEYNWCQIDIWAFRLASPWRVFSRCYRDVLTAYGSQASSISISKENKATGAIADIHIFDYWKWKSTKFPIQIKP